MQQPQPPQREREGKETLTRLHARYNSGLQWLRQSVARPDHTTDPERLVQTLRKLKTLYHSLCQADPEFRAEERSKGSTLRELQEQVSSELRLLAQSKPLAFQHWGETTQFKEVFEAIQGAATPKTQQSWWQSFQEWATGGTPAPTPTRARSPETPPTVKRRNRKSLRELPVEKRTSSLPSPLLRIRAVELDPRIKSRSTSDLYLRNTANVVKPSRFTTSLKNPILTTQVPKAETGPESWERLRNLRIGDDTSYMEVDQTISQTPSVSSKSSPPPTAATSTPYKKYYVHPPSVKDRTVIGQALQKAWDNLLETGVPEGDLQGLEVQVNVVSTPAKNQKTSSRNDNQEEPGMDELKKKFERLESRLGENEGELDRQSELIQRQLDLILKQNKLLQGHERRELDQEDEIRKLREQLKAADASRTARRTGTPPSPASQVQEIQEELRRQQYAFEGRHDPRSSQRSQGTADEIPLRSNRQKAGDSPFDSSNPNRKQRAQRVRNLMADMAPEEISRTFPAKEEGPESAAASLDAFERYAEAEERHWMTVPRPGQGYHYLLGDTPFWREPWPSNWQVCKPWEFENRYNQIEMQQRLKNVQLKIFRGDADKYTGWQRVFFKVIHVQDMDVDLKYDYLTSCLSENVFAEITANLDYTQSDYCMAITRLEETYGVKGKRTEKCSRALVACPPFAPSDLKRAVDFLRKLQGYLSACAQADEPSNNFNLMGDLKRITPQPWVEDFTLWAKRTKTEESPESFYAHLKPIINNKLEQQKYGSGPPPSKKLAKPVKPVRTPSPTKQPKKIPPAKPAAFVGAEASGDCEACCGDHVIRRCPTFLHRMNHEERRDLLEQHFLCLICFGSDHDSDSCYNRRRCALCNKRHSAWVHTYKDDESEGEVYATSEAESEGLEVESEGDLSGEFLGAGFMTEAEFDTEDSMEEMSTFVGVETTPPGPRRSPRLKAKREARTVSADNHGSRRETPIKEIVGNRELPRQTPMIEFSGDRESRRETPIKGNIGNRRSPRKTPIRIKSPKANADRARRSPTPRVQFREPLEDNIRPALKAPSTSAIQKSLAHSPKDKTSTPSSTKASPGTKIKPLERKSIPLTNRDEIPRIEGRKVDVGLAQAVLDVQNPVTKSHLLINVVIDTASNHTAVSERVAKKLGLEGLTAPYYVTTFGGDRKRQDSRLVRLTIRSLDGKRSRTMIIRSLPNLCGRLRVHSWNDLKNQWQHMKNLQFTDPVGDHVVDLLLGAENGDFVCSTQADIVGNCPQDPLVRNTIIGLIPMGLTQPWKELVESRVNLAHAYACHGRTNAGDKLAKLESTLYWDLRRLFAVEHQVEENFLRNTKDRKAISLEQARAAEQILASKVYDESHAQYQVGIPWKSAERPANNLWAALRLFKGYVSREGHGSERVRTMMATVSEWITNGYARVLTHREATEVDCYLIPSFIVTRTDKQSTQHRLVINAAKAFNGQSINDYIASTPDAMNELYSVLLRFRLGKYAYTADVRHMFLRIRTDPRDARYLRIFYQPVAKGPIQVVECSRHLFGLKSSPFVAMEIVKSHARDCSERWPLASQAVIDATIVDDVLTSGDTEQEVTELHGQLEQFFASLSMKVHKCASSCQAVMETIPEDRRAKQTILEDIASANPELMPVIKTLGLVYEPIQDHFRFEYHCERREAWTLRKMVSTVAGLYDPLGLVSPFLMMGRAIVQLIWTSGKKWDDRLDEATQRKCDLWAKRAIELVDIKIPRRLPLTAARRATDGQLSVFSDACKTGYAAAAYWTSGDSSGLVSSRTRVAPSKKEESVQRLELAGCQLGVEVAVEVCHALGLSIRDVAFFTDSVTTLAWLRTTSKMSVFVGNRVCKIRDRTELSQWNYVPGELNPADIASRGARPKALADNELWFQGPRFLTTGDLPKQPTLTNTTAVTNELVSYEAQLRKLSFFAIGDENGICTQAEIDYIEGRNKLSQSLRILSLVRQAVCRLRRLPREHRVQERLMERMIQRHQKEYFKEELETLMMNRESPRSLRSLRPFLDERDVLRINSRLNSCWWLDYRLRNPILLRPHGFLPTAILRDVHQIQLRHAGGPEQLLNESRKLYWITSGRSLAKKVIDTCQTCRTRDLKIYRPVMANLHPNRLGLGQELEAFRHVGVDMAGPFITKGPPGTRTNKVDFKRYMLIVSCTVTRAVCLELMMSAEADSCIMALERFSAVYGTPVTINSDSGANFVAIKKEIERNNQLWTSCASASAAKFPDLKWTANPPYSANWGGHFERLIGSAKTAMAKVMMNRVGDLRDEELLTVFKKVQDILNNRPITTTPTTLEAHQALTPNCFLKVANRSQNWITPEANAKLFKRHRLVENVITQYWKVFIANFIPKLHRTEKWTNEAKPIAEGDLVAILLPHTPNGRWPLAKVTKTFPGKDKRIRSVEVLTYAGGHPSTFRRSSSGLMVVPGVRTPESDNATSH